MTNINKIVLFILFVGISIIIGFYTKSKKERMLSLATLKTVAIYKETIVHYNTGPTSYFLYKANNVGYILNQYGKFDFLQKGDTVLIEYSKEDPSVARVIDFKYMQKFKEDKE